MAMFGAITAAIPEGSKYAVQVIPPPTTPAAPIAIDIMKRKKYATSPKRPDSHGTHSKRIASAETKRIGGGARSRYCLTNVHGSSGAPPRTATMAIAPRHEAHTHRARKSTV